MAPTLVPRPNPDDDHDNVVVPLARAPHPDGPRDTSTSAINRRTLDRHWIVVSILAHLVVVGALLLGLFETSQPIPPPVLRITLVPQGPGSAGAAGGGGGNSEAQSAQPAAAAAPEIPAPAPEPVAPPAPVQPEIPPPTPPQPEIPRPTPPQPEIPTPAPEQIPPTAPQPVLPPTSPPVKAEAPPVVVQVPPPKPKPPRRQAAKPRQTPQRTATPIPAPAAVPTQPQTTVAPATPGASTGPGAAAGPGKGAEGAGHGAIGNSAGPGDDYLDRLYQHLLRYKKGYPPAALSAKQQGSVEIGFTVARDGSTSNVRIEKSSGFPALDEATLELVRRASPVPPLPDSYKGNDARAKFPIEYKLSLIDQMF